MDALRTIGIFIAATLGELGGTYAVWRWRRDGSPFLIVLPGMAALFAYALVQTYQPQSRYGRVYAAYASFFLVGAMVWDWAVDGVAPDRFDLIGAVIVLVGVATIVGPSGARVIPCRRHRVPFTNGWRKTCTSDRLPVG